MQISQWTKGWEVGGDRKVNAFTFFPDGISRAAALARGSPLPAVCVFFPQFRCLPDPPLRSSSRPAVLPPAFYRPQFVVALNRGPSRIFRNSAF